MNFWNTYLIFIGIGIIILTTIIYLIKYKIIFCSEKYFNKLESMYGNIDKKRIVKLEVLYRYVIGLEYIVIGLFIRKLDVAIIALILVSIITIVSYYLVRKKYITV
ncbi:MULTISPECIES: hypothetical protein [unclassified Clostridioides]|uniref:hypothetical protein n=1 Tax=unclassified Clostridioides TaxID=2635829 RepID=UPI001D0C65D8|nr:hypothetical protein [Clostridioides sp. ES-S-0001-02]MCC0651913.1 hypothetical protein [Clostridioides sp. ES-S-0001-03]MCC0671187.1 hypothetical protein [Clostridioides sp. ES-S-0145-01]MCC0678993.1 hypothetical protein [Clostridioides sp. ES-S-0005-03]MCC0694293.1 hypothetical protein [Clostridioides sp. ES-S-0048-02]MCC0703480.1 hypothetical protein [Clostridioides sp. ES-S-0049-02]MCC0708124.1 hypothetical protein [Clostridioides sp. ES-S-0190-01]UDN48805.1 hypothetical protein JJJ25